MRIHAPPRVCFRRDEGMIPQIPCAELFSRQLRDEGLWHALEVLERLQMSRCLADKSPPTQKCWSPEVVPVLSKTGRDISRRKRAGCSSAVALQYTPDCDINRSFANTPWLKASRLEPPQLQVLAAAASRLQALQLPRPRPRAELAQRRLLLTKPKKGRSSSYR